MDNFSISLPVLLLFVSTLISISLGVFIFTRRRAPGSVALGVLALLIAEWSLTYGLEIAIPGLAAKVFWAQWQYIGIAFIPFAWLLFAVFYTRQDNLNRRLAFIHLLGIFPLITVAMVFTNEAHGLIWSRTFLNTIGGLSVLGNEHGAWFWVHFAVSYVFLLVGAVILLRGLRRMQGLYRAQIWALFFAVALPWVGNIVYFVTPIAIDPTPFAFTITIALLVWAIFGYRLTDIAPIARDLVVEGLREGLIVLDMQGRIVDVNAAAARFIGLPPTQIIGRPSAEILQPWQGTMERFRGVLEAQEIVEIGRGEAVRQMEVRIAPLYDNRRNLAGRLITFLEIRERSYRAPSAGDEPLTQPLPQQSVAKPAPKMTAQPWSLVQKIGTFFNPPLLKLSTDNQSADETAWQQTIERIFVVTLRVLLSLVTPLWLVTVNYFLARNLPLWLVLGSVLTLLWGLSLSRNIAYGVRAGIFLSVFYLVGLVLVLSYGYSPESFATLLFFIALSGMFLKNHGRAIAFSIAALTVALIGWLIIAGAYLPFAVSLARLRPSSMETFLASLLSYLVLSGGMMLIVSVVFRNLTLAIQQETQTRNLLQQERDLLEQRVRERTADLRETRDLALQSRDELRKYYQAIEQSGNSIVITDVQGNIQYVNPFFEKITGYTLNEVLGKNPRFLKSGNQPLEFYRFMWKTIANGQVWRGEFLNRRKDGSLYWELATIAPVKDDKGKVTNYVAIKEDITAQKELRETLARQNDYLATLQTITLDLLNRRDQQELLDTIMQRGMSLLKAERATIALLEDGQLVYSGVMGEHASQKGQVVPRDSMSLMWQAFETRRPVFVDDFTAKFGPRSIDAGRVPLRAVADFPILSGGKALGVLGLGRESAQPFTNSEIEFGQALAQIAALVLDNITLYQSAVRELDERKRIQASLEVSEQEQRALASVLQTGMRDAPLEDILLSSLEQLLAIEWLGIEAKGGIFLKDPQKDTLHLVVERNLSPQICALCKKVDFGKCLCGRAALTRQLQFSSHVDDLHEINYEGMNDHGHYNVPILSGDETLGVIVLYLPPGYHYNEHDIRFLNAFATTLSNIIRRKHSEASIQQFLEDMKALQEVSLALSQVDDLEQLYVQMITLTQTRMGIDRVGLFVLSEDGATLQGTFGVSPEGTLRDERNFHEAITPGHWTEEIIAAPNHTKLWLDAPLYDNSGVVGQGWKVAASLWNGHQSLGFLVCDALLSGRPPRPYEAELIAQLGSTLGHLIERKRADERLRESETRFRQIIENASDIIYRMDALGRTTYINPVGLNLIGYENEAEALGKHFTEFVAPSWRSRVKAFYKKQAIEQKDNTYYEFLGITKQGREIWIGQNVQLIRSQDGIIGFQAVARDITELKNTQFALAEARDQALDASRFKSQLLSRVSHELRTPLGGVMGYAELLQQGAFGPLSEEQQDAATNIVASANYLNIMINELLDQAQIEARAMQIHIAPFEPERLLHSVESNMRILAQNKNLQLTTEFDPSLPPQLMGDERRLQQVIINLTGNAIKFTQQGEVRISLLRLNDAQWGIRVTDTGAGIPKEAQEYIFDPFRQVDNAITRHNRGTGLGLSITKQLVELMGGSIDLQSEVGRGSTFTIILPLHTPSGA